ncbi:MAG TPA: hypothetical protein VFS73_01420 [Solirubrobacterales bacterium]|nr:hypothetical protein [Solirubrobacterales bacterium]
MSARDRVLARTVSGPIGRGVAFVGDLAVVLWRAIRGEPARPLDR